MYPSVDTWAWGFLGVAEPSASRPHPILVGIPPVWSATAYLSSKLAYFAADPQHLGVLIPTIHHLWTCLVEDGSPNTELEVCCPGSILTPSLFNCLIVPTLQPYPIVCPHSPIVLATIWTFCMSKIMFTSCLTLNPTPSLSNSLILLTLTMPYSLSPLS